MRFLSLLAAGLFRRARMEREMAEELAAHMAHRADDLMRAGYPPADAARRARLEFGAVEGYKESCREARGLAWFDELRGNLRFTARSLRASPGYALAAVLSLAIGIGANLCAFVSVNAIILHPFPFPDIDRIMLLGETTSKIGLHRDPVAPANFFDWKENSRSFASLSAFRPWDALLTGAGEPERVTAARVTADFFVTLGMAPAKGRGFLERECQPGDDHVAVVSRSFQKSHVISLGQSIALDGRAHTVIGIMPDEFDFPLATQIWAPLAYSPEGRARRGSAELAVVGRLKTSVTVERARAEMAAIASTLAQRYPQSNDGRGVAVEPIGQMNEVTNRFVAIVGCAAGFVLLLACANIGNLQLARFTARQKELGLRAALGASRFRLVRQLLTESLAVSAAGGLLGWVAGAWQLGIMKTNIPAEVLRWVAGLRHLEMDGQVMFFGIVISLAAGIACTLPSIYQLLRRRSSERLNQSLKEGGRGTVTGRAGNRARALLVSTEMALALVLLVGAGVMVRTFEHMMAIDAGFDPKGVLTLEVTPSPRDAIQSAQYYQRVLLEMNTISGVESAAVSGGNQAAQWEIEGRDKPAAGEPRPDRLAISSRYFQTMRIPVKDGRSIGEQDAPEATRVVVISESLARYYWRASSPLGRRIRLGGAASPWLTVVGVCGDIRDWFGGQNEPTAYTSYRQDPPPGVRFVLRTARDPIEFTPAARLAIRRVDANQAIYNVKSMEQILAEQTSGVRSAAMVMSIDAAIALLLALMGAYSVSAFFVAQRTQEFGVRMALGASPRAILRMVMAGAARTSGAGLAVGMAAALALCITMSHVLYGVVAIEPLTFTGLSAMLTLAALVAAFVPARRATRVDPMIALRSE
ncbi:MAG TPA: ABC transporter permease [Bryobacteraceae bacterium]|nr:ABC transporter permease [Bryobacteraceae bacterium]